MPESSDFHLDPVPRMARPFQGQRAGVVTRTIAGAVDYTLVAAALAGTYAGVVVLAFLVDPRQISLPHIPFLVVAAVLWVSMFLYLLVGWALTGRTIGCRLMGVRVLDRRGKRMRWGMAAVRSAFCVAFPVGLFWCVVSRSNRSVQDVVLRTSVVHDWSHPASPPPTPPPPAD